MLNIPGCLHKDSNGNERLIDISTRLLQDRIVLVQGEVTDELAESVVAQLLHLESVDNQTPINMIVSGPGGSVVSGEAIISAMNIVACPVYTTCMGCVASMSALIAVSGEKGHRQAYPNTQIMMHTVSSGASGKYQDLEISLKNVQKTNEMCMKQLAEACGKSIEQVKKDCDRDFWMDENEAIEYGFLDSVTKSRKSK